MVTYVALFVLCGITAQIGRVVFSVANVLLSHVCVMLASNNAFSARAIVRGALLSLVWHAPMMSVAVLSVCLSTLGFAL